MGKLRPLSLLVLLLAAGVVSAQNGGQLPLPGSAIPKFVDPLPLPATIVLPESTASPPVPNQIELQMTEITYNVLPTGFLPANGLPYAGTHVWSYLQPGQTTFPTYIGPVIVSPPRHSDPDQVGEQPGQHGRYRRPSVQVLDGPVDPLGKSLRAGHDEPGENAEL